MPQIDDSTYQIPTRMNPIVKGYIIYRGNKKDVG